LPLDAGLFSRRAGGEHQDGNHEEGLSHPAFYRVALSSATCKTLAFEFR
jgi:hypothetical protein